MTNEQLRDAFRSGFSPDAWNGILHEVFGAQHITKPVPIAVPAGEKGAKGWTIGELDTPDHAKVGLFLYEVRGVKTRRVGLRALVKSWTGGAFPAYDAALVAFMDKTSPVWRVSLICDLAGGATAPKRFTYLFGDRQGQYRTPVGRFAALAAGRGRNAAKLESLREAFSVEALCREFYDELFGWYQWALSREAGVTFPNDTRTSADDRHNLEEHLIRLVTRLMFVWFIRQKGLVPPDMLDSRRLTAWLKFFDPLSLDSGNFYNGILQNLFFATLDNPIPDRAFATDKRDGKGQAEDFGVKTLYRNPEGGTWFTEPEDKILAWFKQIPFLNGGLFECLDRTKADLNGDGKRHDWVDGFSRNNAKKDGHWQYRAFVPNALFFAPEEVREFTVGTEKVSQRVSGLLTVFGRYHFTIEENSPDDADVALDPELLGKVFENLLGTYNPETRETARKSSGSFYTPREIVAYMVDEALRAYLLGAGVPVAWVEALMSPDNLPEELATNGKHCREITDILLRLRALDPACGSGAFPMGLLGRMVALLRKLDPGMDRKGVYRAKLAIIRNCLHGVDIQCIAVQICKLRFFISLICDQEPNLTDPDNNYGIDPLPNLETKFVAANTLVALRTIAPGTLALGYESIESLRAQISGIREKHFAARTYREKLELRKADAFARACLEKEIANLAAKPDAGKIAQWENTIAALRKTLDALPDTMRKRFSAHPHGTQATLDLGLAPQAVQGELPLARSFEKELAHEKTLLSRKIRALETQISCEKGKKASAEFNRDAAQLAAWDPYDQNTAASFFDSDWMFGLQDGFDIVIGNPPYIQLQANHGELANLYAPCGFETFARTGDIYCLFYERAWQLLKNGGRLCYITSNKWMRAGYGENLRKFLAEKTNPEVLVDFAGERIFESATVDTNILLFQKGIPNAGKTLSAIGAPECRNDLSAFVRQRGVPCAFVADQSWVILSPIEQSIKAKIERIGTPLKDWDVHIYRGILTGCNEAFIIGEERRKEILSWCKSEEERTRTDGIIRPILRGRDIKRYGYDWANLFILALFPARHYDIEDYPALKRHLLSYAENALIEGGRPDLAHEPFLSQFCRAKLEQSGQPVRIGGKTVSLRKRDGSTELQKARKRTANKWFETQDAIAYWDDFSKPKIVWGNLCLHSSFAKAPGGMFANAPSPMLVPYSAFLLGVLNSKLSDWYIRQLGVTRNGGYFEYKPMFVEQLPVPRLSAKEQQALFAFLTPGASLQDVQDKIDESVFKLYRLLPKERAFILAHA